MDVKHRALLPSYGGAALKMENGLHLAVEIITSMDLGGLIHCQRVLCTLHSHVNAEVWPADSPIPSAGVKHRPECSGST